MQIVQRKIIIIAILLCAALNVDRVQAFMRPLQHFQPCIRSRSTTSNHSSSAASQPCVNFYQYSTRKPVASILNVSKDEENNNDLAPSSQSTSSSKRTTALRFKGEQVYKSEPVPILHDVSASTNDILSFFQTDKIVEMILNGDRDDCVELIENQNVNESLFDQWTKQAKIVGASPPSMSSGDDVFQVQTGNLKIYGLNIKSNSLVGVKYLEKEAQTTVVGSSRNNGPRPEYELVFIQNSQIVEGPKVLEWIYNQLTGKKDESENEKGKEQTVRSLSRFTFETTPDNQSIIFCIEASLEIVVKFPSLLLKILPVSKEKAEQQGSASVIKMMGKDIEAVLPKLRSYYLKTFEKVPT